MLQLQVSVGGQDCPGDIGVKLGMVGALGIHNKSSREICRSRVYLASKTRHETVRILPQTFIVGLIAEAKDQEGKSGAS